MQGEPNHDSAVDAELSGSASNHYTMVIIEWLDSNFDLELQRLEVVSTTTLNMQTGQSLNLSLPQTFKPKNSILELITKTS
jgi:hypothetical protein